tara:strand:- start:321 stop:1421 length:1101 start_codon:yes stop_codon:yes gene_type:complete
MINIESNTGLTQIQLLDNPFVNEWKQHFITMLESTQPEHQLINYPYIDYQSTFIDDHVQIRKRITQLYTVINELNDMGTNFPVSIQTIDDEITKIEDAWDWFKSGTIELDALLDEDGGFIEYQYKEVPAASPDFIHLLNKIHRCCTVAVRNLHAAPSHTQPNTWSGEIFLQWVDSNPQTQFKLNSTDIDRFYTLMELGNNGVHKVDCVVPTQRKQQYYSDVTSSGSIETIEFHFNYNSNASGTNNYFITIPPKYHKYASDSDEYNVWLAIDILGKNYQEAYFDNETPLDWDTTQPLGHSAGFHINLTSEPNTLQSLIRSKDMQEWFTSYGVSYENVINNYPLGSVIAPKRGWKEQLLGEDFKVWTS